MKNQFAGVLEGKKTGVEKGEKKNKKQSHSRVFLSGIFNACRYQIGKSLTNKRQVRGRSPITAFGDDGLYVYKRQTSCGFTLIELLVVVLIIGILAAVALPQYQKAVEKSRAMQAMTLVKSLGEAAENYYLANGTFPTTFDQLDVDIPADWTGTVKIYESAANDPHSNGTWSVMIENDGSGTNGAIHLGKITGDYAGAGFSYYVFSQSNYIPTHQLLCMEVKTSSSYVFGKTPGDFCAKIFQGTQTWDSGLRLYTLP